MTGWIVFGAIVLVVGTLVVRARTRSKVVPPGGYTESTMAELSAALQDFVRDVRAANEKCEQAHGPVYVVAWRELHATLASSTASVRGILGDRPRPRIARMVRLTEEEVWDLSERHLAAHTPTTPEDIALAQRGARLRAESVRG